jgi:transcription initiation factor TFIIIB Brf1 subunit/transcription initiation factor TFIIB
MAEDSVFDIFSEIEEKYCSSDILEDIQENCEEDECQDEYEETKEVIKDFKNKCKHENVVSEQGTVLCKDCGLEISKVMSYEKDWRYYGSDDTRKNSDPNRCHIRKIEDKSIYKDVENLGFSDKIVNTANDIYTQVTKGKIFRGNSRKAIIFGCIFHSIKLNGKSYTCDSLREIFKLDRKVILRGLKHVSLNAPKTSHIRIKQNFTDLIEECASKFELSQDDKKEILDIYEKVKNRSPIINRSRPQSVTSSLIYFFLCKKKGSNNVNIKDFIKKVKLSELTITKITKEISRII